MTRARRLLAILAGLAMVAVVCLSQSQGDSGKNAGPVIRPVPEQNLDNELARSKFESGGIITYRTLKGENLFALQLQPKLAPQLNRKRDYLVMICNAAAQAGEPWIASTQIADAIVQTAGPDDRIALWIVSTPEQTKALTKGFLFAKEDRKQLDKAIAELKNHQWPAGTTDLKNGLAKAIASFDGGQARQRILLYLGDGQSTHNPIDAADRYALIQDMVKQRIGFFPVPLGLNFNSSNLHGLATGSGGAVLRTRVNNEKLPEALKRYQDAFAAPVLYDAQLTVPAAVTKVTPQKLPPLRADVPTLVVGRMNDAAELVFTVSGSVAGQAQPVNFDMTEKVTAPEIDNYFLVSMVNQWDKAPTQPALIRADRALALAYENTRLYHGELLLSAQFALEKNDVKSALRLYEDARALDPNDAEARAGIKLCANLQDGKLTRETIKAEMAKGDHKLAKLDKAHGVVRWAQTELVAQLDKNNANQVQVPVDRDDLLQAHRDRVLIEEQRMSLTVATALQQARKELAADPDGALDYLRNTLARVKDHPDLSEPVRDALAAQLETALREIAIQGRAIKLQKAEKIKILATVTKIEERERERQTIEDRTEAQFRVFKNLMALARFEEHTKNEVLDGLKQMAVNANLERRQVPLVATAAYEQTSASFNLQRAREMRQLKEQRFLETMLSVDKSNVPFSDEPAIYFPPLKTWQAISNLRKEKYIVSSLPDDPQGTKEAAAVSKMLLETIPTKNFEGVTTIKDAIEMLSESVARKNNNQELPILIDVNAFKEENADAPDLYEAPLKFPKYPKVMSAATALRIILSFAPTNNATYLIRRSYIEVTTLDRMVREKVLRVYPVGDLVIPISQTGGTQSFNLGGGQAGQAGQIGQIGGQLGQLGGQLGGIGGIGGIGGLGALGGGLGALGALGGGLGALGGGLGALGGGLGALGALGVAGIGQPVGTLGNFQGVAGSFNGGAFQGGFNGSLGMFGASQAVSLISTITKVVAPGEWFITKQPNPFQAQIFAPFGGGAGAAGVAGFQGANANNLGVPAGGPQAPVSEGGPADIQQANTIEFFPPSLAIIVRAPSRIHTSPTGGLMGGKGKRIEAARFDADQNGLDRLEKGKIRIANAVGADGGKKKKPPQIVKVDIKKAPADLDPTTVWNEAIGKGGVDAGMVVATADFLFEAGQYQHAAEFLKANLRAGIVVRPWVYEALAVALEASGGSREDINRARLSAVSLDPSDAQGFMQAARTMADQKQYDRALAFCRQAALLEPSLAQPYAEALAYAELGKDSKAMEWAIGRLLSQDWSSDNSDLHLKAQSRGQTLAQTLQQDNRRSEADKLKQALQTLRRRDLVITLSWDSGSEPADLELEIKEPTGTLCSRQQTQTPGGGILLGTTLTDMKKTSYMAAQAFTGVYEIKARRLFGQPLGNRAFLDIIQNLGTPQETRRRQVIRLDQPAVVSFQLKSGRRTELASVAPPIEKRPDPKKDAGTGGGNVLAKLRGLAFADASGATQARGAAGSPGTQSRPSLPPAAYQNRATPVSGAGGVNLTAQFKVSADQRETNLVLQPVFQTVIGNRSAMDLPLIPGSGPAH